MRALHPRALMRVLVPVFVAIGAAAAAAAPTTPWMVVPECEDLSCAAVSVSPGLTYETLSNERLALWLPAGGRWEERQATRVDDSDFATEAVWQGRLAGDDHSNVSIALGTSGTVVALITASDGATYRVEPRGAFHVIDYWPLRIAAERRVFVEPVTPADICKTSESVRFTSRTCPPANPVEVPVLVAYTADVASGDRSGETVAAWIRLAESRTNQSLRQSGVTHRVRLIPGGETGTYSSAKQTIRETLGDLVSGPDLKMVRDQMAPAGPRFAVLLDESDQDGLACPMSRKNAGNDDIYEVTPFAVVGINGLSRFDGLTHELGHLLGAGHVFDAGAHRNSHGYLDHVAMQKMPWKSIMQRDGLCPDCAGILYWSNTTVEGPGGLPMGNLFVADNAATLDRTLCSVALGGQ